MFYHTALRTASAIALTAALGVTPAKAADLGEKDESRVGEVGYEDVWTGAYVSGALGYEQASVEDTAAPADLSADGFVSQARLGYDQLVGNRFLLGLYTEGRLNDLSESFGDYSFENDWTWGVGGRAGVVIGNTLIYGTGGWAQRDISISEDGDGFGPDEVGEWFYGGGVELHAGGPFFAGLEVRQHISDDDALSDVGVDEADSLSAMLSVTFKADPFQ